MQHVLLKEKIVRLSRSLLQSIVLLVLLSQYRDILIVIVLKFSALSVQKIKVLHSEHIFRYDIICYKTCVVQKLASIFPTNYR